MISFEEKQKYLNFRKSEYVSDIFADKLDDIFGKKDTHEGWSTYNFVLVLQVLDLVPDEELDK